MVSSVKSRQFGYDKIETMPADMFNRAIEWINNHQLVCHQYYMAMSRVERNFINTMKQQDFEHAAEIGTDVLMQYEGKNLLEASAVY